MHLLAATATPTATAYPLIILILAVAWVGFAAGAALWLGRLQAPEGWSRTQVLLGAGGAFLLALGMALVLSPGVPVLCTYTGLTHITSAYHIAGLEWNWTFSTDYPLAVPVFAAAFVRTMGASPESFSAANSVLFALGAAGTFLLALVMFKSRLIAIAAGLLAATAPLGLLLAGGDGLSIGYYALSPWVLALGHQHLAFRRKETLFALAAALVLATQARPEGLALFALVFLLVPVHAGFKPSSWVSPLLALAKPVGAALLLSMPHLAGFYGNLVASGRVGNELGTHWVWKLLAGAVFLAAAACFSEWRRSRGAKEAKWSVPAGVVIFVLITAAAVMTFGIDYLTPSPVCVDETCTQHTFATVLIWFFNPTVSPLGVIMFFIIGLTAHRRETESRPVALLLLWAGVVLAAASTKATGELPFEGARTQLPATVPFVIIAAVGIHALTRLTPKAWVGVLVAAVLVVPSYPLCVKNVTNLDYDAQREFAFLQECLPRLEPRAVLFAPDDDRIIHYSYGDPTADVNVYHLFRLGYLTEAMSGQTARVRVAETSYLLAGTGETPENSYFFRGLACRRTGGTHDSESCNKVMAGFSLEPVCETTIPNRMYTSDFFNDLKIVGDTVTIGVYKINATP